MADSAVYLLHSKCGAWDVRIDRPHGSQPHHQEHVHVSRKRLGGEYSWNKNGSRHDKARFPSSEKMIGKARKIAAEALQVPESILQLITATGGGVRVSVRSSSGDRRPRVSLMAYIRISDGLLFFGHKETLVAVWVQD